MLKRVAVNILRGERFIYLTIIGEFDNLNIQSLFGSDLFGFFSDFSVRPGEGEENFVGDSEIIALGGASNETKDRPLG